MDDCTRGWINTYDTIEHILSHLIPARDPKQCCTQHDEEMPGSNAGSQGAQGVEDRVHDVLDRISVGAVQNPSGYPWKVLWRS